MNMALIKSFIKRHPVIAYYFLTFAVSWGAIFTALGSNGIPATKEQFNIVLPVAIFAMLIGPSVAAILLTGIMDGKAGFRDLRARLLKRQVSGRWYAVALLAAPLLIGTSLFVFSMISPGFPPSVFVTRDRVTLLLMGVTSGVIVGICEELGWSGFALPRLRQRYSVLTTGVIMGILWGAWHIASHAVMASGLYSAPLSPTLYIITRGLALMLGPLLAFRVLMVWVYAHTESLLVIMLMHFSYTAFTIILEPFEISGTSVLIFDLVSTVVLWIVIEVIAMRNGFRHEREGNSPTH
jgi:membrane protease YdiL (CAAX protease family)